MLGVLNAYCQCSLLYCSFYVSSSSQGKILATKCTLELKPPPRNMSKYSHFQTELEITPDCFASPRFMENCIQLSYVISSLDGCKRAFMLRPYREGEGTNKKSNSLKTTSFSCSISRNQHRNGPCCCLGSPASFPKGVIKSQLFYIVQRFCSKI